MKCCNHKNGIHRVAYKTYTNAKTFDASSLKWLFLITAIFDVFLNPNLWIPWKYWLVGQKLNARLLNWMYHHAVTQVPYWSLMTLGNKVWHG